ncbi:MAG: hypothetical protein AAF620_14180 [Bacteroidota bacterium]
MTVLFYNFFNDPTKMRNCTLGEILNKDFSTIIRDMVQFRDAIPSLAKIIGVDEFREYVGLTKNQYYARKKDPEKWSLREMEKASEFFKSHNFGNINS